MRIARFGYLTPVKPKIETVLFDIDGTLDDSNDAHANSWVDALEEAGYPVAFDRIRPLIGLGSDKLFPKLDVGLSADDEPGSSILKRRREIFLQKYLPGVKAFPGSRDLVAALRERNYRLIVASSASEEELTPLLRIAGVEELFDHAMTPNEVENSKPDPDIVHAALAWSKTSREHAVMIGDSHYDMEAASEAGVAAIALRCGGTSDGDLALATAIFDTPADLLRALEKTSFEEILAG